MRLIAPLLLLLLMFAGVASAGDYYVSTTGSNGASGDLTHPWQNVSYATQQAVAGDMIYLFDGIWYNEHADFANSGNATHPITLTAYNGTPTLNGTDKVGYGVSATYGPSYINVSGLTIEYYYHGMYVRESAHVHYSDCIIRHTSGTSITMEQYVNYSSIDNCTCSDSGYDMAGVGTMDNCIAISGTGGKTTHHISVTNCKTFPPYDHSAINLFGPVHDIDIIGNNVTQRDICSHFDASNAVPYNINISNNIVHDYQTGIQMTVNDSIICNNTIYNVSSKGFENILAMSNVTYSKNTVSNSGGAGAITIHGEDILFDQNYIHGSSSSDYSFPLSGGGTIRDATGKTFKIYTASTTAITEFMDGKVFSENGAGVPYWYPDKSNYTITNYGTMTVTTYNITLIPTNAYLKDVTVNHESDAADDRTNISVNSSVSTNPTWVNATMQNTSNTYNVSVDGGYVTQVVSDANKIVRYKYTSSWSPHDFEFDWFSDAGFLGAPDPTNLANTTGETWVRHSWSAGSGNVTDSYNASINLVWYNTSPAYYNNTGLSAESWSNITVWAYNNTGGISQNSISQNTQSDAASWNPSNTASYYNNPAGYAIEITTKTDGTNLFSRTPTQADGNATSGRMVVKTS